RQLRPGVLDVRQVAQPPDVDQLRRTRDPKLQRRDQRVATGEQLGVVVRAEQLDRVIDALRHLIVERCGDHCLASWIARQTRSGVAGIWMSSTPRWESASATAFITAAPDAIVPVSPTPFTPSGLVGLGVVVESSSNDGSSTAEGTRY